MYTRDHEWVSIENGVATMGITDYAQDALGDVVFVGLPELGSECVAGDAIAEVESTKSVSDIYAPVSGKIVEVNPQLNDSPELVNSDPYGNAWICRIQVGDSQQDQLLDIEEYRALLGSD